MANGIQSAEFLLQSRRNTLLSGSAEHCFELGVAYSCGTNGLPIDLVEAHKWFNLAALGGSVQGQTMRAEIAEEMTAQQIAEAQRQARALMQSGQTGTA